MRYTLRSMALALLLVAACLPLAGCPEDDSDSGSSFFIHIDLNPDTPGSGLTAGFTLDL